MIFFILIEICLIIWVIRRNNLKNMLRVQRTTTSSSQFEILSDASVPNCRRNVKKNPGPTKRQPKNVLQNSNKLGKTTIPKTKKQYLKLEESVTISLNDKISQSISKEYEKDANIKYLSFTEFKENEHIKKQIFGSINRSKKIVILTGAGISCNAGIPDFRSDNGLYNKKLSRSTSNNNINGDGSSGNGSIIKGKEMFDISVYRSVETIKIFNNFIKELYQQVLNSKPTKTHEFIKKLQEKKKLIKCYTQNIDGLERECGLTTKFDCDEWNETEVIQLHGDLHELSCNACKSNFKWDDIYDPQGKLIKERIIEDEIETDADEDDDVDNEELMMLSQNTVESFTSVSFTENLRSNSQSATSSICEVGCNDDGDMMFNDEENILIECPKCIDKYENRMKMGKRCLESSIGIIRPNIVLYGEEHPHAEKFAKFLNKDLNKKPNLLIIFGTSLKVNGVKNLVKNLSKKIHENGKNGIVVLVNKEPISNSFWKNYIDYQIVSDCDAFCNLAEKELPIIFSP